MGINGPKLMSNSKNGKKNYLFINRIIHLKLGAYISFNKRLIVKFVYFGSNFPQMGEKFTKIYKIKLVKREKYKI